MMKSRYFIGMCGHFGIGKNLSNGQTIKTKIIYNELCCRYGDSSLVSMDTCDWKNRIPNLLMESILLVKYSRNIIILPAHKGLKVLIPLFVIINKLFHKKLLYIVIGGWLPDHLQNHKWLVKYLRKLDSILVEKKSMISELNQIGLNNVYYLPNFKKLNIIKEKEICFNHSEPLKLCIFSRIIYNKGIEDAIKVVINLNKNYRDTKVLLDIYGPIDMEYKKQFNELMSNVPEYINYRGVIEYEKSVETLMTYYLLLFPTRYYTEGIPGTIIDAFSAGLPVLASRWKGSEDIIDDNTGLLFNFNDLKDFESKLQYAIRNPLEIDKMRKRCLLKTQEYSIDSFFENFSKFIH